MDTGGRRARRLRNQAGAKPESLAQQMVMHAETARRMVSLHAWRQLLDHSDQDSGSIFHGSRPEAEVRPGLS
jgi:hypothetical protein